MKEIKCIKTKANISKYVLICCCFDITAFKFVKGAGII